MQSIPKRNKLRHRVNWNVLEGYNTKRMGRQVENFARDQLENMRAEKESLKRAKW